MLQTDELLSLRPEFECDTSPIEEFCKKQKTQGIEISEGLFFANRIYRKFDPLRPYLALAMDCFGTRGATQWDKPGFADEYPKEKTRYRLVNFGKEMPCEEMLKELSLVAAGFRELCTFLQLPSLPPDILPIFALRPAYLMRYPGCWYPCMYGIRKDGRSAVKWTSIREFHEKWHFLVRDIV